MTVSQLIAAYLAGEISYIGMNAHQRLEFQLYAAQGGFQGASS